MTVQLQFKVGTFSLNYAVAGSAGAPPLILLHGVTHRWQAFDEVIPALAVDYRVYAVDLRGHGESGRVPGGYHAASYAQDILGLVEAVTGTPVTLIGHSLGALVALQMVAELGDDVAALVLMEPPLIHARQSLAGTPWQEPFARTRQLVRTARSEQEIEEALRQAFPEAPSAVLRGMGQRLYRLDPEVLATLLGPRFMRGYDLDTFLQGVTCPTLLVQSDPTLNSVLEEEDVRRVMERVRACRHLVIPDAIHTLHFSHPQQVGEALVTFLAGNQGDEEGCR